MNSSSGNVAPAIKREGPAILLTDCDSGGTVLAETLGLTDNATNSYNLSVNVNLGTAVSNLLAAESACTTPRTPEILNSLIAMTNPLDQYSSFSSEKCATAGYKSGNDSNSSVSNGSSATSPASGATPSVQKTCSELIKAGLKLSIESKRKMSGSEGSDSGCMKRLKREDSDDDYDSSHTQTPKSELTPEDEERRRRRRERNKIAATKCRLKKRERTHNLVTESEVLETQNIDLKTQLKDLEVQRRQLVDMLNIHTASCLKHATTPAPYEMLRYSPTPYPPAYDASPYIRPESANILASSYSCATPASVDSAIDSVTSLDSSYLTHHLIENEYNRPESVMSIPMSSDVNYPPDYMPKANLLVIEPQDGEYYEQDQNYHVLHNQQCHNYDPDKMNGLNNGCMA